MWQYFCYIIQLITIKLCTNFRTLTQVVAEKSLTEKKFTNKQTNKQTDKQANIITEKAKTIYPLYTYMYWGYNYSHMNDQILLNYWGYKTKGSLLTNIKSYVKLEC